MLERVFWGLVSEGLSTEKAVVATGVSVVWARRWFVKSGGMSPLSLAGPASGYLSFVEREEITVLRAEGRSMRSIARELGRAPSTISRELDRNALVDRPSRYRALSANLKAELWARRPRASKLGSSERLRAEVQRALILKFSPGQISHRLVVDFPDDPEMRVSHEMIYQAIYVQGHGGLRRELAVCLRTGRALRKPQRRADGRVERIKDKVMISERPAEVADRAVPGHWEGDLITGTLNKTAIGTLVERSTRFTMLLHLPADHGAEAVAAAIVAAMGDRIRPRSVATIPGPRSWRLRRALLPEWARPKPQDDLADRHLPFEVSGLQPPHNWCPCGGLPD